MDLTPALHALAAEREIVKGRRGGPLSPAEMKQRKDAARGRGKGPSARGEMKAARMSGKTVRQIAEERGVHPATVYRQSGGRGERAERVKALHEQGHAATEIARRLGVRAGDVLGDLDRLGVKERPSGKSTSTKRTRTTPEDRAKFFDALDRGSSLEEAAAEAGVHRATAFRWSAGQVPKEKKPVVRAKSTNASRRRISPEDKDKFHAAMDRGMTVNAAASEVGINVVTGHRLRNARNNEVTKKVPGYSAIKRPTPSSRSVGTPKPSAAVGMVAGNRKRRRQAKSLGL